jgi:sugar/nucleoside kinase (ribokinase family)
MARDPQGGDPVRASAPPVEVSAMVSTLGAGDVFHGALLAALVDGRRIGEALARANVAAGLACQALDGRSAIPDRDTMERVLARAMHREREGPDATI